MKFKLVLALGLAVLSTSMVSTSVTAPAEAQNAYANSVKSTVRVVATMLDGSVRYGTGWVIEPKNADKRADAAVVITAAHVVVGADKVRVIPSNASVDAALAGSVFKVIPDRDTAFLEVKDLDSPPLKVRNGVPIVGSDIAAAGYTNASDANETGGVARVASIKRGGLSKSFRGPIGPLAQAPINQVEYDASVLPGFSGGPVLDPDGCVVGMTISDGGHIPISKTISIATAQGVATAVAGNEIVAAAAEGGVALVACGSDGGGSSSSGGANGKAAPPPPPPTPQACTSLTSNFDSSGAPCIQSSTGEFVQKLTSPVGIAVIVAVLALVVVLITALVMMGRNKGSRAGSAVPATAGPLSPPPPPPPPAPAPASSRTQVGGALRLTGRGPTGDPVELRLSASDLTGRGMIIGHEGDAVLADNRPKRLVSGKHALLGYDGRNFTIEDNKSANGTYVGSHKLASGEKRALMPGDTIKLADVTLNVAID